MWLSTAGTSWARGVTPCTVAQEVSRACCSQGRGGGGTKGHRAGATAPPSCAQPRRDGQGCAGGRGPVPGGPTAPFVCLPSGDFRPRGVWGAGAWLATEPGGLQRVTCEAFPGYRQPEAPGHPAERGRVGGQGAEPGGRPLPTTSSAPFPPRPGCPHTSLSLGHEAGTVGSSLSGPRGRGSLWPRSGRCVLQREAKAATASAPLRRFGPSCSRP